MAVSAAVLGSAVLHASWNALVKGVKDHLVGFDRVRADVVGEGLLPAPVPPSTTAATLAAPFDQPRRQGIERASAQVTGRALAAAGR